MLWFRLLVGLIAGTPGQCWWVGGYMGGWEEYITYLRLGLGKAAV